MSFDTSDNLSAKAAEVIKELGDSGDSQAFAVADCLNTIAENGDGQSTEEYLIGCAQEIIAAAQRFIDEVQGFPAKATTRRKHWPRRPTQLMR